MTRWSCFFFPLEPSCYTGVLLITLTIYTWKNLEHVLSQGLSRDNPSTMKFWGVLVLAAFSVQVLADSDVLEFNEGNFESSVAEHDIVLVEFFAPW